MTIISIPKLRQKSWPNFLNNTTARKEDDYDEVIIQPVTISLWQQC